MSRVPSGSFGNTGSLPFGFSGTGQWIRYTERRKTRTVKSICKAQEAIQREKGARTVEIVHAEVRKCLV